MKQRLHLYTRFERLWHWIQSALIVALIVTGLEIHSSIKLFGFESAHHIHIFCGWTLVILSILAIFWHATTGQWTQYIPQIRNLDVFIKYYLIDIFKGRPHPFVKAEDKKLNPLQRITYFALKTILLPLSIISGIIYAFPNQTKTFFNDSIATPALLHTVGSFAMICFLIIHVYMTTTGGTLFSYIKAMITGWEEVDQKRHTST